MISTISMCALALLFSYISSGIICRDQVRAGRSVAEKALAAFPRERKKVIYCCIMVLYLVSLAAVITNIYTENLCTCAKTLALASLMFPMATIDRAQLRIPNKLLLFGLSYRVAILILELIFFRDGLLFTVLSELISAVAVGVLFFIFSLIIKNGIGMGDIKFFIMMALLLGPFRLISAVLIIMLIAFFVALYKLIIKKANKKDEFAFGPIIAIGSIISFMIFGS